MAENQANSNIDTGDYFCNSDAIAECDEANTDASCKQLSVDEIKRFIEIYNKRKGLEKEFKDYVEETSEEYSVLERKLIDIFIDMEMPQFITEGSMVFIHNRGIIKLNNFDDDSEKKAAIMESFGDILGHIENGITDINVIRDVIKEDDFSLMESEEVKEAFIMRLMDMETKQLMITAMKCDEELSYLVREDYNTQQMTSFLHDMEEQEGELPKRISPFVKTDSIQTLRVKKNAKSKAMKYQKN